MKTIYNFDKKIFVTLVCIIMSFSNIFPSLTICSGKTTNVTTFEELNNAITNAQDNDTISVSENITIPEDAANPSSDTAYLVATKKITIEGKGDNITIKREDWKSILECFGEGAIVTLKNITFDGGAIWATDTVSDTTNNGVQGRAIIDIAAAAVLNVESGTVVQNGHTTNSSTTHNHGSGSQPYGGGIRIEWSYPGGGTINLKSDSAIRNCKSSRYGGGIGAYAGVVNICGGTIERCCASLGGGASCTYRGSEPPTTAGILNFTGGLLQNNYANSHGGAIDFEGEATHSVTGGTIKNNTAATSGGAISSRQSDTLNLASAASKTLTITGNSVSGEDNVTEYEGVYRGDKAILNIISNVKTVAFNTNGGNSLEPLSVTQGTSLGQAFPGSPIRSRYIFSGWFTDNNTFKNQFTSSGPITGDITVYAKWTNEDTTGPQITCKSLTYLKNGTEEEYKTDTWSATPITVTFDVEDQVESGGIISGIDLVSYEISLDGGTSYFKATDNEKIKENSVEVLYPDFGDISGSGSNPIINSTLKLKVSNEGKSDLKIKVSDRYGNIGYSNAAVTLQIDTTPPDSVKVISPKEESWIYTKTPTISGTGEACCTVRIKEGETILGETTVAENGAWQLTLGSLSEWIHNFVITQTNRAGTTSPEVNLSLLVDTSGAAARIIIVPDGRVYWVRPGNKDVFKHKILLS